MELNNMANKKKERNPQHETNSISPTLSYIHNGMHVTISFADESTPWKQQTLEALSENYMNEDSAMVFEYLQECLESIWKFILAICMPHIALIFAKSPNKSLHSFIYYGKL